MFVLFFYYLFYTKKKRKIFKIIVHIVLVDETWQDCTEIVCGGLKFFTLCVEDNGSCEIYSYFKGSCEIYSYLSTPRERAVLQFKSQTHCEYCVQVVLEAQVLSLQKFFFLIN